MISTVDQKCHRSTTDSLKIRHPCKDCWTVIGSLDRVEDLRFIIVPRIGFCTSVSGDIIFRRFFTLKWKVTQWNQALRSNASVDTINQWEHWLWRDNRCKQCKNEVPVSYQLVFFSWLWRVMFAVIGRRFRWKQRSSSMKNCIGVHSVGRRRSSIIHVQCHLSHAHIINAES